MRWGAAIANLRAGGQHAEVTAYWLQCVCMQWAPRQWAPRQWAPRQWAPRQWALRQWAPRHPGNGHLGNGHPGTQAMGTQAPRQWAPRQWAPRQWAFRQWAFRQWAPRHAEAAAVSPILAHAGWRCDRADLCNEAPVVDVTAGQQHIQAGQVSMQDVHAMQMGHAACYLPNRCQNRRQVWQAMHGRPVGTEPASVNAILPRQKATSSISGIPCFV